MIPMKYNKKIKNPLLRLIISIAIVLTLAFILSSFFYRLDLTTDKRYTLSPYTRKTLKELKDIVYVRVYLDGDLNIPFRKMQQRIRETLDEFRVYAGENLEYEFINPFTDKDAKMTMDVVNKLYEKGLKPSNIIDRDKEGGSSEKLVFPGALITFRNIEVPVNLLKNTVGAGAEENINNSIQALEFEFMRVISSLSADTAEKIAFLEGQGELNEYQVGDITRELGWYFQVDRGKIDGKPGILDQYKAVIIAKPTDVFQERDKFVLDQYIMQGGKVLWFIDMVNVELDSISSGGATIALIRQPGIEDMLFRYGVRINPVLVQDMQCNMIPVNVALSGNPSDFRPVPWLYSPLLATPYGHSVTCNLNLISTEFTGCIDTLEARKGIKKTVLLRTSEFTRIIDAPVIISLDEINLTPRQDEFRVKYQPIAVLLEGEFESAFRNRMISGILPDTVVRVMESGLPSAMLVVADGDMIRNDSKATPQGMMISPLGYDRFTQRTYGNKDFIMNAIQYLTGHQSLINLRSRQITLRLLDKTKIKNDRTKWVLINMIGPPLMIIIAGIFYSVFRKRKYTRV
jgi:gliding-associated putative ABC transporter substrate-binding component GldG